MSGEGVTLISRVALVAVLIIVTAFVRVLIGPSRRRGLYMGIGTLGGMSAGVAIASLTSRLSTTDSSAIFACLGIFAGWGVAWLFARQVPRDAH
jgi:drug/metabolite transporter (DMT)-like permease